MRTYIKTPAKRTAHTSHPVSHKSQIYHLIRTYIAFGTQKAHIHMRTYIKTLAKCTAHTWNAIRMCPNAFLCAPGAAHTRTYIAVGTQKAHTHTRTYIKTLAKRTAHTSHPVSHKSQIYHLIRTYIAFLHPTGAHMYKGNPLNGNHLYPLIIKEIL